MKSVKLMILLVAVTTTAEHHLKSNDGRGHENTSMVAKEEKRILQEKTLDNAILTIDSVILKSVINSKTPLTFTHDNRTKTFFFNEFKKFMVSYSWSEPYKNDVLKLVADFNRNNFDGRQNESIRLYVSFPPRNDINDDMELMIDVISEINSVYPGTVTALVVNYGLLQLDRQSFVLVNHEIKKASKILGNLRNQNISLALQLDIINCHDRIELVKNLELVNYVDKLFYSVSTKTLVAENKDDCFLVVMAQIGCLRYLVNSELSTFHMHMSVKINLEKGSYYYSEKTIKHFNYYLKVVNSPILFWAELDGQQRDAATTKHNINSESNPEWVNWLRGQPIHFNKMHIGAAISSDESQPARIFENFHKVMIEISAQSMHTQKMNLEQILTRLLAEENNLRVKKGGSLLQVTMLVTITKNDFELNKKQVDMAIWAATYGNQLAPGSVHGIAFDWISCSTSEVCSGYTNKKNPNLYCSSYNMEMDMEKLYNYAKFAVNKTQVINSHIISWWDMMDVEDYRKVFKTKLNHGGCDEDKASIKLNLMVEGLKFSLSEADLTRAGAAKMFNIVTAQLSQYNQLFAEANVTLPYRYFKVVGCNSNYSSTTHLTEFVLLYEKLNNWAVSSNITLYMDAGIENMEACQVKRRAALSEKNCKCGWWVVKNTTFGTHPSSVNIWSKKDLVVKLYESKLKISPQPITKGTSTSDVNNKILVWFLLSSLLFSTLVTVIAVVLVLRYQNKYIMTREEVANFLKGRLQESDRNKEYSAENAPYNSTKYELAPSAFKIGAGEFGKVFRGSITRAGGTIASAVKVANTRALGRSHGGRMALMGLLSEIKVLSYLGEHENVIALLGAFTANLRRGELLVFLEFCELGSLYSYLRSIQPNGQDVVGGGYTDAVDLVDIAIQNDVETQRYTLDKRICDELYGYCGQIAFGMAYLSSKNVVHADLASRNVLLTGEKVAKICDFGLSRRMYDYSEYVKQSQEPMPWRWMSPESLQRMLFNEKSDVWAFGITLWEIFTLGDEPYPGLSYDVKFPAMLARGLQLPEPRFNVKEVYTIMKRCWNVNPVQRPSFAELNTELREM